MTRAELIERIMEKVQEMNSEEFDEFLSFLRAVEADEVDCKNWEDCLRFHQQYQQRRS